MALTLSNRDGTLGSGACGLVCAKQRSSITSLDNGGERHKQLGLVKVDAAQAGSRCVTVVTWQLLGEGVFGAVVGLFGIQNNFEQLA